jgi:hypothetical protein
MTPLRVGLIVPFLLLSASCAESASDDHGVVKVELQKAAGQDDPFVGTTKVVMRMTYGECLSEFYNSTNTEYRPTGAKGGPVFEEWAERLCDPDDAGDEPIPDCSVTSIDQVLGDNPTLRIEYAINDPDLYLKVFRFGPLPVQSLVPDCVPEVVLDAGSVLGFSAANEVIWGVESFTSTNTAYTDQSGDLWVRIAAQ